MLSAYFDESYDSHTMCIGGFMATDSVWGRIEPRWAARIRIESEISGRQGLKPLSRYHATDCASMVHEFAGWDVKRQIHLTKRLLDIIGTGNRRVVGAKPIGVACGIAYDELRAAFPELKTKGAVRWHAYKFCMAKCLQLILDVMRRKFPDDRVTVIYDRTEEFDSAAQSAYNAISPLGSWPTKYFVSMAPGDWQTFVALQSADMLAFEGFRRPAVPNGGKNTSVVRLGGLFAEAFPSGLASARQGPFRSLNKWACLCEACLIWQTTRQSRHGGVSGRPPDRQAPRERMWSDESLLPAHQADEPGDGDDSV